MACTPLKPYLVRGKLTFLYYTLYLVRFDAAEMDGGSEDLADPDKTIRVGTLMLAGDYYSPARFGWAFFSFRR